MALILSIETSTDVCSVALHEKGVLQVHQVHQVEKSHSTLLPKIALDICREIQKKINDIDAVAVSGGPGSYTGLRIGFSVAKGFAYSLQKPVLTVPTLDIMIEAVRGQFQGQYFLGAMMDARRMEVYIKVENEKGTEIWAPQAKILTPDSFDSFEKPLYLFGNGMPKFRTLSESENLFFIDDIIPEARHMGRMAFYKFEQGQLEDVAYCEPEYLKKWQTTTPKKKFI